MQDHDGCQRIGTGGRGALLVKGSTRPPRPRWKRVKNGGYATACARCGARAYYEEMTSLPVFCRDCYEVDRDLYLAWRHDRTLEEELRRKAERIKRNRERRRVETRERYQSLRARGFPSAEADYLKRVAPSKWPDKPGDPEVVAAAEARKQGCNERRRLRYREARALGYSVDGASCLTHYDPATWPPPEVVERRLEFLRGQGLQREQCRAMSVKSPKTWPGVFGLRADAEGVK
jgi:hypothetical protein